MRVVHVAPTVFGAGGIFGGGERYPLELARAVAAEAECELVAFGPRRETRTEDSGLRVTVLRALAHLGQPAHPVGVGLGRRLRHADVVHTHHLWAAPTRVAAAWTALRRQPLVVTDHGLISRVHDPWVPKQVDRYLTVSRHSAAVIGAPSDRTGVIYGGVDPTRFFPEPEEKRDGVLFVGRNTPHKGIDVLLRALPDGARLIVAGTTGHDPQLPEREYPRLLRSLAAGKDVRFVDEVPDDELPKLHRRAQVVVLPSVRRTCYGRRVAVSELLGLTLLEAMASGTPVVASRIGGMPEVVDDGVTGFVVEPGDVEQLHDRISTLLADDALAHRMGRAAREVVCERFTWAACARRCLDAYRELLQTGA